MATPTAKTPIPSQIVNELAAFGPLNLRDYFTIEANETPRFSASLSDGTGLPAGMICTEDGLLTGIPAKETSGTYDVLVTVTTASGSLQARFNLMIKPAMVDTAAGYIDQLKAQVWQALDQKLPAPDLSELYNRAVSVMDVYYLLERWSTLVIWNATDLSAPAKPVLLTVPQMNEHYQLFDRGSCVVATPKDLFSHERTLADAIQASRALAREIYKREWVIEFTGFEKMVRAAWVEFQCLEDKHGKKMEILRFDPGFKDIRVYMEEQKEQFSNTPDQRNE